MPLLLDGNGKHGYIDRLYLAVIIHKFFFLRLPSEKGHVTFNGVTEEEEEDQDGGVFCG